MTMPDPHAALSAISDTSSARQGQLESEAARALFGGRTARSDVTPGPVSTAGSATHRLRLRPGTRTGRPAWYPQRGVPRCGYTRGAVRGGQLRYSPFQRRSCLSERPAHDTQRHLLRGETGWTGRGARAAEGRRLGWRTQPGSDHAAQPADRRRRLQIGWRRSVHRAPTGDAAISLRTRAC
jgi:hypothetical protein